MRPSQLASALAQAQQQQPEEEQQKAKKGMLLWRRGGGVPGSGLWGLYMEALEVRGGGNQWPAMLLWGRQAGRRSRQWRRGGGVVGSSSSGWLTLDLSILKPQAGA